MTNSIQRVRPVRSLVNSVGMADVNSVTQNAANAKAVRLINTWGNQTDLIGRELSYGNGQENMVGVRNTGMDVRIRVVNNTKIDRRLYFLPSMILGTTVDKNMLSSLGLDSNGVLFFDPVTSFEEMTEGEDPQTVTKTVEISSINTFQDLKKIANVASYEPFNITRISMRSFSLSGTPENTNFGNSLVRYFVSPWQEPRRGGQINFSDYQTSRDFSTEILKIDFINLLFPAVVSQSDILEMLINANTKIDITFNVGARASLTERFSRKTRSGFEMIQQEFDNPIVNSAW